MTQRRWLARSALVLLLAAAVVMIAFAGPASVAMVVVGAIGTCLVVGGAYWFLAHPGVVRWIAFAVVIAAPIAVLVVFALHHLLWAGVVSVVLIAAAIATARLALAPVAADPGMPVREVPPPKREFVIMNPRSGDGKVGKFGLKEKAEALGAEGALLEGPGVVDVAALARQAVADGADLLGVAGGDGTQALVAGIAAEHDLPFLVISAGTRNHFAMDLGLDRDNPAACLDALTGDGVEQRIDLGVIGGRTFVNNASFGAYASRGPSRRSACSICSSWRRSCSESGTVPSNGDSGGRPSPHRDRLCHCQHGRPARPGALSRAPNRDRPGETVGTSQSRQRTNRRQATWPRERRTSMSRTTRRSRRRRPRRGRKPKPGRPRR